ncbi:MAG TPA: tetratricopeptide repeat protein, partial [Micromonosporaceae bacterium]|nr:tetratricopeptide repeat protein [Micromonosporaceae bacterium]
MSLHPTVEQADALIKLGRYDQARALLARRLAEDPDDVRAWVELGWCHLRAKDPGQALAALDEALTRDPENVAALVLQARSLRSADQPSFVERWQQAEAALRTALRVAPHNSSVHAALGELLSYLPHRRAEAIEAAREAVRLDPEKVTAYDALWMAAGAANDVETYRWALRQVLRLDPTNGRALLLVSGQQAHGTSAGQAATVYADALAVNPDSPGLRDGLDRATYRLLRGTRWLALICLAAAGATVDLFPVDGEPGRDLPVPLGNRLW